VSVPGSTPRRRTAVGMASETGKHSRRETATIRTCLAAARSAWIGASSGSGGNEHRSPEARHAHGPPVKQRHTLARLYRSTSSSTVVDRGLAALGIALALGSATFATTMIVPGRPASPSSVQLRAIDVPDVPVASNDETPAQSVATESFDEDPALSLIETESGARSTLTPRSRHDPSEPSSHGVSGYVLRYADVGAALVQGPGGTLVVTPGSVVPDAGLIRAIEKRRGRWVVVTATGTIDGPRM
jgi:hypothetical protein